MSFPTIITSKRLIIFKPIFSISKNFLLLNFEKKLHSALQKIIVHLVLHKIKCLIAITTKLTKVTIKLIPTDQRSIKYTKSTLSVFGF